MSQAFRRLLVKRALAILAIMAVFSTALIVRLIYWQILDGGHLAQAALAEQYAHLTLPPERGVITDRNGHLLALETTGDALYAMPRSIQDPAALARALAPIIGQSERHLQTLLSSKSVFLWLSYHVTAAQAARIEALGAYNGLGLQPDSWRIYPEGNLAGAVIGFVGVDQQGLAGIEESYNRQLAGRPGAEVVRVDALGNQLPQYGAHFQPAVPGDGLRTTLDSAIQTFAQQDLNAAVKANHAKGGRILVLDPNTGAILAMAQYPEPSPANWQSYSMTQWVDQPVEYAFEPGSTIKPFTLSAALASGVVTPKWTIDDTGSIVIDGIRIYDWIKSGFGVIGLDTALAMSSDVAFATLAMDIGMKRYYSYLHLYHLDRATGIDLPGEASGIVPPPASVTQLDMGEMGFGQTLAVTPLQLAAAVATVASGGVWHTPHVGQALLLPNGKTKALSFPSQRVVSQKVAGEVQSAMLDVVAKGTGNLAAVKGYAIAGKTGTANVTSSAGGFKPGDFLASFIGYGPVPNPKVLTLVQIDDPKGLFYGGDVAAPIFSQLMGQIFNYLGLPPTGVTLAQQTVSVPNVVGKSFADAALHVAQTGLLLKRQGTGVRIVAQSPRPGQQIVPGATLTVTLGGGNSPIGVPDLLGLTAQQVYAQAAAAGYTANLRGSGVAVQQSPAAGTSLKPGRTVSVYLSPPP
ncbi:MAG: penicillin-binding transpeptidase domain-containing protein [Thermaerobacter sp.]|nr:penicillin-binding transpeptidase domain-containing protein [Thermaerobacter sp.]